MSFQESQENTSLMTPDSTSSQKRQHRKRYEIHVDREEREYIRQQAIICQQGIAKPTDEDIIVAALRVCRILGLDLSSTQANQLP